MPDVQSVNKSPIQVFQAGKGKGIKTGVGFCISLRMLVALGVYVKLALPTAYSIH